MLARVSIHLEIGKKQQELIENNSELTQRSKIKGDSKIRAINFLLGKSTCKATYKDKSIELTHLEFNLLYLLYQSPERIYSRAQILDLAYPDMRDISDRTVDAYVKNIRH